MDNSHVVQVESAPKSADERISISISSNQNWFEWIVTPESPIILFTEVTCSGMPVVNAKVYLFENCYLFMLYIHFKANSLDHIIF